MSRLMLMARRVRRRRPLLTPSLHSSQPTRAGGMLRFLFIAVVACDGAYMGATTNVPQQLALGTPLSCRAAPAVAVMSKKTPKQTPWYEKEVYKSPEQRQRCAAPPVPAHTWSTRPSLSSTACPASPSAWGAHKRHRTCCCPAQRGYVCSVAETGYRRPATRYHHGAALRDGLANRSGHRSPRSGNRQELLARRSSPEFSRHLGPDREQVDELVDDRLVN